MSKDLIKRLRDNSRPGPDGCTLWTKAVNDKGYGFIKIGRKLVRVHRLVFELNYGLLTRAQQVDHECRVRNCINPDHLRIATNKQNRENLAQASARSSSGYRGVYWDKRDRKWRAKVKHNGQIVLDKQFKSIDEARAAATAKRTELYTHNTADRMA